jgi:hypothetical protein
MEKASVLLPIILGILLPSNLLAAPSLAANTTGLTARSQLARAVIIMCLATVARGEKSL